MTPNTKALIEGSKVFRYTEDEIDYGGILQELAETLHLEYLEDEGAIKDTDGKCFIITLQVVEVPQ